MGAVTPEPQGPQDSRGRPHKVAEAPVTLSPHLLTCSTWECHSGRGQWAVSPLLSVASMLGAAVLHKLRQDLGVALTAGQVQRRAALLILLVICAAAGGRAGA